MSPAGPPWPLGIVTGYLGSGKTTFIGRLLGEDAMADTVVVVNEIGEVGLDHHLIRAVTDSIVLLPNGCLCCTVREDLAKTLRDLHRAWRSGAVPDFGRVVVETTGLAEPGPLVALLAGNPLLAEAYGLTSITTIVDAQHALRQIAEQATARRQACVADLLVLSKCDLVGAAVRVEVEAALAALNPLASRHAGGPTPSLAALVFSGPVRAVDGRSARRSGFACDPAETHLAGVSRLVLRPRGDLSWPVFTTWLGSVLERHGDALLRLKGCLRFSGQPAPLVIQAVHHTFYPVAEAPQGTDCEPFLVLMFEGPVPAELSTDPLAVEGTIPWWLR